MQVISVPPEDRLTQEVSGRRASASAMGRAAFGAQRTRRNHSTAPSATGSMAPNTRTAPTDRSRAYRRAMVRSDTPRTSAMRAECGPAVDLQGAHEPAVQLVEVGFHRIYRSAMSDTGAIGARFWPARAGRRSVARDPINTQPRRASWTPMYSSSARARPGLMLANELRVAGISAVLVDRLPRRSDLSRAGGVQSRTQEALDQRGLMEPLLATGETSRRNAAHFAGIQLPLDPRRHLLPWRYMPQVDIEGFLSRHLAAHGHPRPARPRVGRSGSGRDGVTADFRRRRDDPQPRTRRGRRCAQHGPIAAGGRVPGPTRARRPDRRRRAARGAGEAMAHAWSDDGTWVALFPLGTDPAGPAAARGRARRPETLAAPRHSGHRRGAPRRPARRLRRSACSCWNSATRAASPTRPGRPRSIGTAGCSWPATPPTSTCRSAHRA